MRLTTATNQALIGAVSTTSLAKLEVIGSQYLSGDLGIGTTSPYAKLSVVGQVVGAFFTATTTTDSTFPNLISTNSTTTSLAISNIASTSQLVISSITAASTQCLQISSTGNVTGTGSACGGAGATPGGSSANIQFNNAGSFGGNSGLVYEFSTGRVGISTTTPYAALSISTSTRPQLVLSDSSAGADLKHWFASSTQGSLILGTVTDNLAALSVKLTIGSSGLTAIPGGILVNSSTSTITNLTTINSTSTSATTTNLRTTSLSIGSLNGPLDARNGVVGATTSISHLYGGTGLTATPTFGQILRGTGSGYTLVATSTLGINFTDLVGTASVAQGGTGISSPTAAGVLLGSYAGGSWQQLATSSLGIALTNTTGTLAATRGGTGLSTITNNQLLVGGAGNTITQIATSSLGLLTTNVAEGTNLYYLDSRVQSFVHASTTIPKTYATNTFTGANTFNSTLIVGSLNGPLQANNGSVSATTSVGFLYGGTGLTGTPTFGQILRGTGSGYTLVATSTLGIALSDTTGTLSETRGGTNQTAYATGDIIYASNTNTLSRRAATTNGFALALVSGVPTWVATTSIPVGGNVSGTLSNLTVVTNANLSGVVTSSGNTTSWGSVTNGVLANPAAGSAVPSFIATSTMFGTGTGGQVLGWSNTTGGIAWVATSTGAGGGVTSISIASANGFAGSSSGGTTPALTISTSISGVLKGNGTAISAAANGTDFTLITAQDCSATGHLVSVTAVGTFTCSADAGGGGPWTTLNNNIYNNNIGYVGIGTTTPRWALTIATSTAPQLTLGDGTTANPWSFRSIGGNLYVATSSSSTFATSTIPAISIIADPDSSSGQIGIGSSTPWGKFSIEMGPLNPAFVVSNQGSSTPAFFIGGVNQNGNVGIGTASPGYTLDVNGDVNVASGKCFRVNGVCIGYTVKLAAIYATSTPGTDVPVVFTGAQGSAPSFSAGAPGTLTLPSNTSYVVVEVRAGGGGGGNNGSTSSIKAAGGGGQGGYSRDLLNAPSGTYKMTVGLGGAGGTGTGAVTGTTGGASCFGSGAVACTSSLVQAAGGLGGVGTNSAGVFAGGAGGLTTTAGVIGDYLEPGAPGGASSAATAGIQSGFGGGAGGGLARNTSGTGNAGTVGGGGSGGLLTAAATTQEPGGKGGDGVVIISIYATSTPNAAGNDYAEMFPVSDHSITAGDIVSVDAGVPVSMKLSRAGDTAPLAGIISTAPGQVLGDINATGQRPVALAGRVPTKVNLEGGRINIGDRITLSSVPGVGKKGTMFDDSVGIALETYDATSAEAVGKITVFMDLERGVELPSLALSLLKLASLDTLDFTAATATDSTTTTAGTTASLTGSDFVGHIFAAIVTRLERFGVFISETATRFTGLIADRLTIGSAEKPSGVTLYDEDNSEPYCLKMKGGQIITIKGECGGTTLSSMASAIGAEMSSSTPPSSEVPAETSTETLSETNTEVSMPPENTTASPPENTVSEPEPAVETAAEPAAESAPQPEPTVESAPAEEAPSSQ